MDLRPVFAIVALYITAEKNKHIVKLPAKNELLKAGDVPADEFKRIYDQMKSLASEAAKAAAVQAAAAAAAGMPSSAQRITAPGPADPGASAEDEDAADTVQALIEQDNDAAALLEQDEAEAAAAAQADLASLRSSASLPSSCRHAGQVLGGRETLSAAQAAFAAAAPVFGKQVEEILKVLVTVILCSKRTKALTFEKF